MSGYPYPKFVNMRRELTLCKEVLEAGGFNVFRTRTACNCTTAQNQRDAIIAIHEDNNSYQVKVIRCKGCRKGGTA
jgi:hypothetical protein